jgi:prevent-host-death family protein
MQTVNIHPADTHLSQLVDAAAAGEDIVLARDGKPLARLVAMEATRQPRQLGTLAGRLGQIPDDFDAPLPDDLLDAFEGR